MQQANVTREKAIQALVDAKGDLAKAILNLTT
jgi:nascent polypeptide-associated complex subunit alpha